MQHTLDSVNLSKPESLQTLVENRTSYSLERCELNVFETYKQSYNVPLTFNDFVITSMLRGKKVMHLFDQPGFDYFPGQTVIVPPSLTMKIDFPEATAENPTQCIALAIDKEQISKTISYLNEFFPKENTASQWELTYDDYHFYNNEEITYLMDKVIKICSGRSGTKDIFADLTLKELLVRIMQSQTLKSLSNSEQISNTHSLAFIVNYIKTNLTEKISVNKLSEKACMSKATFYRLFKRELGISPNDFILSEKIIRAKQLLSNPQAKVAAVSFELGFSDPNYFIRAFKKIAGITPGSYHSLVQQQLVIH